MLINIITITLGIILGVAIYSVCIFAIMTSKWFVKWYTKKVAKMMNMYEEASDELEDEI